MARCGSRFAANGRLSLPRPGLPSCCTRIRLHVQIAGEWKPVVCAVSWIDRDALCVESREALAAGQRMLGEILASEPELAIVEAGLDRGVAPELAAELDAGPDASLLLRWRYWSREPGRAAVLLLETARVTLPE
jgi:chorismate-pyruvate lyase